jgi:phosphoglucosamine mutase
MRQLFGTDGIRGIAGEPPLDRRTIYAIGAAVGGHLARTTPGGARVVIGQDTRESSSWIAATFVAGFLRAGVEIRRAGIITTPGVAFLARQGFTAGIVISASHNPWRDNGIKVFGHDGYKLSDEVEEHLEQHIFDMLNSGELNGAALPESVAANLEHSDPELLDSYVGWLVKNAGTTDISRYRVLVDCANGAATPVAHAVFHAYGVPAAFTHDRPDGRNINEHCGALHPEIVAQAVADAAGKYDLGITFDGDADRALFSDAGGRVVNGDGVMLLCAREMQARGVLAGDTVVATTMSNMGLEIALRRSGFRMLRAPVGDKYVLEEMRKTGATLGGEQSGHVIFRDGDATTGDGLLTALRVLEAMARADKSLAELVADLKVFPQTIKNVRVREKKPLDQIPEVAAAIRAAEQELDGNGRVVVRYSGTEALARVMIEAESEEKMRRLTDTIAGAIQKTLGA